MNSTSFVLCRWTNPETTSDYPFLAVAEDRSILLAMGNYRMSFELGIPEEATAWLAEDFAPTGESRVCDLSVLWQVLEATFVGGIEFGLVTFDTDRSPNGLQLSLATQVTADQGPEYVLDGSGHHQRFYRESDKLAPVAPFEQAMLDACAAIFAELATTYAAQLTEPPPPRYRASSPN